MELDNQESNINGQEQDFSTVPSNNSPYTPQQKGIAMLIVGFAIGFACALPIGYSAGHKTAVKYYQNQKAGEGANMIKAAVEAVPSSGKTLLEEYQRKNTYFKVSLATGGEVSLEDYKGKPVLLMFYTETCPYCRKAAPEIEKLYKKYSSKGLAVVGMCGQPNKDAALRFSKDLGTTFPMAYNVFDAMRRYGVQGVPFIYLLNKDHELEEVWPGFAQEYVPVMEDAIKKALSL